LETPGSKDLETIDQRSQTIANGLVYGLGALEFTQSVVSRPLVVAEPNDLPKLTEHLRTYILALTVEVSEFLQENNWKPWRSKSTPVDPKLIEGEFVDILAFLGIIIHLILRMYPQITLSSIATAYVEKSLVNLRRIKRD